MFDSARCAWMQSDPIETAITSLMKNPSSQFAIDSLAVWVNAQAPFHSWRTGGKLCAEQIVKPTVAWWCDPQGRLPVEDKYLDAALGLIEELDRVSWGLFGDVRKVNDLVAE